MCNEKNIIYNVENKKNTYFSLIKISKMIRIVESSVVELLLHNRNMQNKANN